MKKIRLFVGLISGIILLAVSLLFLVQARRVGRWREELTNLRKDIQQRQQEQANLDRFIQEISEKQEFLSKRVTQNEKEPLKPIRQLTLLARAQGLTSIEFSVQKSQKQAGDIYRLPFLMNLEGEYGQLLLFLEAISGLERLFSVESIEIERKEEILPRQKITLQLAAYTLLDTPSFTK